MNKTFKVLEDEKDVALVYYAEDRLLNSKCDWQDGALDHILRFYKKPTMRVAIDGGANYGFMSNGFAQHFDKVYSFEINPNIIECLKYNTSIYSNIEIINKGLGLEEKEVSLGDGDGRTGLVRIDKHGKTKSKIIPLDSLNLENVDLIKLDVESYEYEVILGGIETIKKYKPLLYFEWSTNRSIGDENKRVEIFQLLDSIGYKFRDHRYWDFLFTYE